MRLKFNPLPARDRGPAAGRRRRLDRARLDDAQDRADAARRGRARGAPAHLGAADHLALLLRHRHGRRKRRADRRRPQRSRRSARTLGADSLAYLSLEGLQLAIERPADRFCRACLTGELPGAGARGGRRGQAALRARSPHGHERRPRAALLRPGRCLAAGGRRGRRARCAAAVASTRTPRVLGDLGGFAGLVSRRRLPRSGARRGHRRRRHEAAAAARGRARCATPASTCVAMCVNDVLTCGARPGAVPRLHRRRPARSRARRRRRRGRRGRLPRRPGCALLGGETAELPDMYGADDIDLAGFALGIVERDGVVDVARVAAGDALIGLAASGVHSNGFTLVRRLLERAGLDAGRRARRPARADAHLRARGGGAARGRATCARWRTSPAAASPATCRACCRRASARASTSGAGSAPAVFDVAGRAGRGARRDAPRLQRRARLRRDRARRATSRRRSRPARAPAARRGWSARSCAGRGRRRTRSAAEPCGSACWSRARARTCRR